MIAHLPGLVTGLPSGLVACRLNDAQYAVAGIAPGCVYLRSAAELPPARSLILYFYQPEAGSYRRIEPANLQTGTAQRENGAVLTRFCFDDPACAREIRRCLNTYARFLETKSTLGAAAWAEEATGYPSALDDVYAENLAAWRESHFAGMMPIPDPPAGTELAVALNCPELWALWLDTPAGRFMDAYAACRQIPRNLLPERAPDRLYIGNPHCRRLFPGAAQLEAIARKARAEGAKLTLVSAELRGGGETGADALLQTALRLDAEIEINDWGMLERAQAYRNRPSILLGTMLNRRRKDPRMQWKAGFSENRHLLARSAVNDPLWLDLLHEMGVTRLEFESSLPAPLPSGPARSLHLPFYQTNTSLWCPTLALHLHGQRGDQADIDLCPQPCRGSALLYPDHLNLLGRWNSLLAFNPAPLAELGAFDRWVLNF